MLQNVVAAFLRADSVGFVHGENEDLPVALFARSSVGQHSLDDLVYILVADNHLDLDLRGQVYDVVGAQKTLAMAPMSAGTAHVGDGHARDPDLAEDEELLL